MSGSFGFRPFFGHRASGFGFPRLSSPLLACWIAALCTLMATWGGEAAPARIIFDTDVGNDVDDVLALSVLHALDRKSVV